MAGPPVPGVPSFSFGSPDLAPLELDPEGNDLAIDQPMTHVAIITGSNIPALASVMENGDGNNRHDHMLGQWAPQGQMSCLLESSVFPSTEDGAVIFPEIPLDYLDLRTPRLTSEPPSPGRTNDLRSCSSSIVALPNQRITGNLFAAYSVGSPWQYFHSSIFTPLLSPRGKMTLSPAQGSNELTFGNTPPAFFDLVRSMLSSPSSSVTTNPVSIFRQYLPDCFPMDEPQHTQLHPAFANSHHISQLVAMSFGMIANGVLPEEGVQQFLNMIKHYAPRALLRRLLNNESPTACAAVENLLKNIASSGDEEALDFLLAIGIQDHHLSGTKGTRLLECAVSFRKIGIAKRLVLAGVHPDCKAKNDRTTPLILAVQRGDLDFVKILLEAGASVDYPCQGTQDGLLSVAVEINNLACVSMLLDKGATVDKCTVSYYSDWSEPDVDEYDIRLPVLDYAFLRDFTEIHRLLLERSREADDHLTVSGIINTARSGLQPFYAYLEQRAGEDDKTWKNLLELALFCAICSDIQDKAIEVLLNFGVDPDTPTLRTNGGNLPRPLCEAIPDVNLVGRLIDAGADINNPGVIISATMYEKENFIKCLRYLIARGLDLQALGPIGLGNAIYRQNMGAFELLLSSGAPSTGYDIYGRYLTAVAAYSQNPRALHLLLQHGADVNSAGRDGSRAIHGAASTANLEIATILIENGALLDFSGLRGAHNGTVLEEWANGRSCSTRSELFTYLLEKGAPVNAPEVKLGALHRNSLLTTLILKSAEDDLISEVLEKGARVNEQTSPIVRGPRTPIQAAAQVGRLGLVRELHKRGADINAPAGYKFGRTALQAACSIKQADLEVVAYLLDNDADINAKAGFDGGLTAVQGAALRGNIQLVSMLLDRGADLNGDPAPRNGRTALEAAAEYGWLDMVYMLLKAGATCKRKGFTGYDSAVKLAERGGYWQVAKLLKGAMGENANWAHY